MMRTFLSISICTTMLCWSAASAAERGTANGRKAELLQARRRATAPRAAANVILDNGVEGDGHFDVQMDDYGTFGDFLGIGGQRWPDNFKPSPDPERGALASMQTTFATHFRIFTGPTGPDAEEDGANRVCLTTSVLLDEGYNDGGGQGFDAEGPKTMEYELLSENSVDGLPGATTSTFRVTRVDQGIDLNVVLTQTVGAANPGPAKEAAANLIQTLEITNNGDDELLIRLNKHVDEDMPWGNLSQSFWLDDLVGMDFAELGRPQVFAQDEALITAALILRTTEDMELDPRTTEFVYYAAKEGTPTGNPGDADCPDYGEGTFQTPIWNNFGVPNCYKNRVGGVGLNTPGTSPQTTGDSYIGLQVEFELPVGETYTTTFETVFGFRPIPPRFAPPPSTILRVGRYVDDEGLGEFLFTVANDNPGGGQAPDPICELYVDVEAGLVAGVGGGSRSAEFTLLSEGWTPEECTGFDSNGHALFRLSTDCNPQKLDPDFRIKFGETPFKGRIRLQTNDATEDINPDSGVTVPRLSMIMTVAQHLPGLPPKDREWTAVCAADNYDFGPRVLPTNGLWSLPLEGVGLLQVPAMSMWAKVLLLVIVAGVGILLVPRRPRTRV